MTSPSYPSFTAAMDRRTVAWVVGVFDARMVGDIRVSVHRDSMEFRALVVCSIDGERGSSLVLVVGRDAVHLPALRTRVAGEFDIDARKFADLTKLAKPGKSGNLYRFRMDGDGVLYVGSGSLVRSFGVGGTVSGPPPADFLVVSESLVPVPGDDGDTPTMEETW